MGQEKNIVQPPNPDYKMIMTQAELAAFVEKIQHADMVAIDLEADSMFHYREKVCLIQMAAGPRIAVIDPLSVKDLSALKPMFEDPATCKVLHGADYDIRSLYRDYGITINNLFDTQLASMYLGCRETGLEAVVANRYNVELNKKYQKKDWSQRPLPENMIAYAALDVVYLIPLAKTIIAELEQKKRLAWVKEECELLSHVRPNDNNGSPMFLRIKGAGRLTPRQLAVLEAVLATRDAIARQKDRPHFKIMSNSTLLKIITIMPKSLKSLKKSQILSEKQMVMYGKSIFEAINTACEIPKDQLPCYPRQNSPRMSPSVPSRVKKLKAWRDKLALEAELDPSLLLNRALIRDIAIQKPQTMEELAGVPNIHRWQTAFFGEHIIDVLRSKR